MKCRSAGGGILRLLALVFLVLVPCSCHTAYPEKRGVIPALTTPEEAPTPREAVRVRRVLARLLPQVPPDTCRSFGLIPSAVPNASVDGKGILRLTTGLLDFANTDDLLAFALAHELAHAVRHHPRRNARNNWIQAILTGAVIWAAHEWGGSKSGSAFAGAGFFVTTSVFARLPAMRRMETEADLQGKEILIRAGYRPEAGSEFWRRYARARPDRTLPPWLSPHPTDEARARILSVDG